MHELPSVRSQGTLIQLNILIIARNKEREQCVSLFHIVSHEFIKGRPESKGGKSTYLYAHTAAEENFRERNRKMKIINSCYRF